MSEAKTHKRRRLRLSFQAKLLISFAAMMLVSTIMAGVASSVINSTYVTKSMQERLDIGARTLQTFLDARQAQLATSVRVLTADFGFVSAVATRDQATINSVLSNHGQRIGADLALLIGNDGALISAGRDGVDTAELNRELARSITRGAETSRHIIRWQGEAYQLFTAPVKAPRTIARAGMGFKLDASISEEIAQQANLDVSLGFVDSDFNWKMVSSTLPEMHVERPDFRALLLREDRYVSSGSYLSTLANLGDSGADSVMVAMHMPRDVISAAWKDLLTGLALVSAVSLVCLLVISFWLARLISRPIAVLIGAAKRIRLGNYNQPVDIREGGELRLLGDAINTMVEGLAEREERISRLAYEEPTTALGNRLALARDFDELVMQEPRSNNYLLIMFSVKNFKDIAFSLGYEPTEDAIRSLVERLSTLKGASSAVFAFNRESFAILTPEGTETDKATWASSDNLNQLLQKLNQHYNVGNLAIKLQVTGAAARYPGDADNFDDLIRCVETTAEAAPSSSMVIARFSAEQESLRQRHLKIVERFDEAIENDAFELQFQPKINLQDRSRLHCEALIRWVDPELGFIPPDEFILLAEHSNHIQRITQWVLNNAIKQIADWQAAGLIVHTAVNLSAYDLANQNLAIEIESILRAHGVPASLLGLEITESAVLHDTAQAVHILLELKHLGIDLSIDDFGTGHSSLAQLKRLPVDELKIDKSFVMELDHNPEDVQIVKSTVDLGHNLGLSVVAEGVETQQSLKTLSLLGCDKVQGYFFSKPLPPEEFSDWCTTFSVAKPKVAIDGN
ncbi:MAG: EAL domain-containing protein [Pseudomonadaceae bacterium]|nr:EAL domain-containing protein [Pseudomonadaceae bacterium]